MVEGRVAGSWQVPGGSGRFREWFRFRVGSGSGQVPVEVPDGVQKVLVAPSQIALNLPETAPQPSDASLVCHAACRMQNYHAVCRKNHASECKILVSCHMKHDATWRFMIHAACVRIHAACRRNHASECKIHVSCLMKHDSCVALHDSCRMLQDSCCVPQESCRRMQNSCFMPYEA